MSTEKTHDVKKILLRLKEVYNLRYDSELANLLGVRQSTLSTWKARNNIDYDLIFAFCEDINIDWLLTGHGEKYKKKDNVSGKQDKPNLTKLPDIPIEKIKMWLDEFWKGATPREQAWLEVEFERMFPEYKAWLEKKEQDSEHNDTPPQGYNNTA